MRFSRVRLRAIVHGLLPLGALWALGCDGFSTEDTGVPELTSLNAARSALEREDLGGGLAHYQTELRVGDGPFDVIGLHRVVRESKPGRPKRSEQAVFLVHGDLWGFEAAFVAGGDEPSLAKHLAKKGIDVWGIDRRWVGVPQDADPEELADLGEFGFETNISDLRTALATARLYRFWTGSPWNQLKLLGWSSGGMLAYAYVNDEVGRSYKHVDGLIPLDIRYKLAPEYEGLRLGACETEAARRAQFESGEVADTQGQLAQTVGTLAAQDPDGLSPVFPGLTNRQVALVVGGATFQLFAPLEPPAPDYHFTAASFDPVTALPTALTYTTEPRLIGTLQAAAPFQALRESLEAAAIVCDQTDVPWDDHLDEVELPVLYVGAGGGFGSLGVYSTTLLDSPENPEIIVFSLSDVRLLDFGHADLVWSREAKKRAWNAIAKFVKKLKKQSRDHDDDDDGDDDA